MLKFINAGGLDESSSAKLFGKITLDDIDTWLYIEHSDGNIDDKTEAAVVRRFLECVGKPIAAPIYRGVSDREYESVLTTGRSCVAYPISFTYDKNVAKKFGKQLLVVKPGGDAVFVDMYQFNANWNLATVVCSCETREEVEEELDARDFRWMYIGEPEFEVICDSAQTAFVKIDGATPAFIANLV